jgi:hypothetical protein
MDNRLDAQSRGASEKKSEETKMSENVEVERMGDQDKSADRCDQCGKPFGPKKHGGGSAKRFCTYDCRMAWHAAQRKPACTLVPKNSVSRSGQPPGNAPVNVPGGFARTQQKSRTLSEKLKTTMFRNGHGLVIRQSCNKQDDRWILISNASIDTFIETLAELAKDSSGESNAA